MASTVADLNRLAAKCDLAGGHIRNIVLAAAALARARRRRDRANPISSSLPPLSTASSERRYLRDWRRQTHGDTG